MVIAETVAIGWIYGMLFLVRVSIALTADLVTIFQSYRQDLNKLLKIFGLC